MDFRKLVFRTGVEQVAECMALYDGVRYALAYRSRQTGKKYRSRNVLRNTVPIYKSK